MTAIPASSVNLKTMADGTLRISLDIEPMHAQDAFKLFAAPGTQAAIAALKAGTYLEHPKEPEKPKGGELARLAGIWCNDPGFWFWITETDGTPIESESAAAAWMRELCGVQSRADIDHNESARDTFMGHIRMPYMNWQKTH